MKRLITITYETDCQETMDCEGAILMAALEQLNSTGAANISIQISTVPVQVELPAFMNRGRVTA